VLTRGARISFFFNSEHRQLKNLRKAHPRPIVEIHPDTAQSSGIKNGDWVWIETRRGKIRQKARVTEEIDPRVIHMSTVVVSGGGRARTRCLEVECQRADSKRPTVRSGDGHLSAARPAVPRRTG